MTERPFTGVPPEPEPRVWKLLVVDDEPSIRLFLEMLLEDAGYVVHLVEGVQAALAALQEQSFDLVITDKNMPDGNGLEILAWVHEHLDDIEIIMMTAKPTLSSAVQAIHLGVGDYVQKPIDTDDFLARVTKVLTTLELKRNNRRLMKELKEKNARLEELAVRDGLTGLFNHAYFQRQMSAEIKRSVRHAHEIGVVFIDVDNFKAVNDTLGHPVGDEVLKRIAGLLQGTVDGGEEWYRLRDHDIAARYGGDEFVLVLPETDKTGSAVKAERLRATFERQEFPGVPSHLAPSLSLGVAAYPEDGKTREELISAADTALYAAKRLGRNRVMSFTPTLPDADASSTARDPATDHAVALERALRDETFDFVYQPIVNTTDRSVMGYEALCRPREKSFGNVIEVISAAERAGKVNTLGRILRGLAIAPMEDLPAPGLLFINLHPQELNDPRLTDGSNSQLDRFAPRIVFEITETARIPQYDTPRQRIAALRERGFRVALDDLGAGYSGLTTLAQLRPDFVKLDMGLIRGIQAGSISAQLIHHLCQFCDDAGVVVIAEGVETPEEREVVAGLGCSLMQGYLFARPGPAFPAAEL